MSQRPDSDATATPARRVEDPLEMRDLDEMYQLYGELRSCPVSHSEAQGGFYWLSRYQDVRAAALDYKQFSSGLKGVRLPADVSTGRLPSIEMDPPEQGFWRRLYMEAVTPAKLKWVVPRLEALADGLIDRFASAGECDLVQEFTRPLPVLGICETIGMTGVSVERIHELADRFTQSDVATQGAVMQQIGMTVLQEITERRERPREDYLTRIAQVEFEGRLLTDGELATFMTGFFVAGHETTTSALGTLLLHTLPNPDLRARMLADDKVMTAAIEESVRLFSPFQAFHRTTTAQGEVGEATIPADETVRLCWGAANRDPEVFDRPEEFDPDRAFTTHLGFGFGRHVCLGAPLARVEMTIAFRQLLRRLPDVQLVESGPDYHVEAGTLIAPKTCRVTFTPKP
ncbi:cytochrome P450 [Streptomyces violaceusniger]|nr:cytochrome P450 [Streptomyces violaceusniger]